MAGGKRSGSGNRRGARAVGGELGGLTERIFRRHGFAQAGILLRWPEIVGKELAALSLPERLSPPRSRGRPARVLTIRVGGGGALETQHLAPQIIERVNAFYGYEAVERIKIVQGPLGSMGYAGSGGRAASAELEARPDPESQSRLDAALAGFAPGRLARVLRRLGMNVYERS